MVPRLSNTHHATHPLMPGIVHGLMAHRYTFFVFVVCCPPSIDGNSPPFNRPSSSRPH